MKTLKIGILALLLLIGTFAKAQQSDAKSPEARATAQTQKLVQQLGLSADQEKSVYTLCLQHAQQQAADRTKYEGDREGMRNARKQNSETLDANLGKVLTADQKTKYEQLKQEEKANRQQGGGGQRGN